MREVFKLMAIVTYQARKSAQPNKTSFVLYSSCGVKVGQTLFGANVLKNCR